MSADEQPAPPEPPADPPQVSEPELPAPIDDLPDPSIVSFRGRNVDDLETKRR